MSLDFDKLLGEEDAFVAASLDPSKETDQTRRRWEGMKNPHREGKANGRIGKVNMEVVGMAKELAELVAGSDEAGDREMALAHGILGLLGAVPPVVASSDPNSGRTYMDGMKDGTICVGHGEEGGDYEFTYLGRIPGDDSRISIRRSGQKPSVESAADHGLVPYDPEGKGKQWHPTNWTESTGISADIGKRMMSSADEPSGTDFADEA